MRYLGIDYGSKRIGVAVSDESNKFALPNSVILNTSDAINEICKIAKDFQISEMVMGESRDYKGQPNTILLDSLKFKGKLEAKGFKVHLELEFMTSAQAARLQGKNDKLDASAAAIILQVFLDKLGN